MADDNEIAKALGIVAGTMAAAALLIFLAPLMGLLLGAFSGWVVGLFFTPTIHQVLGGFGFHADVAVWQIGATLGWLAGLIRGATKSTKEKKVD